MHHKETSPVGVARLTDYLQERTQDSLRGVYEYDNEGNVEVYYLRDDLESAYDSDTLGLMARQATSIDKATRVVHEEEPDDGDGGIGVPMTAFHTFEHAVVLQVFNEDPGGILASFDKDVASTHTRFIEAVRDELYKPSSEEDAVVEGKDF